MSAALERTTFETSRALEYFSEKELHAQIGFPARYWPIAITRELVDNGLDAAEGAGVAPEIEITTADDVITVADNGPGIPAATIERSLDYFVRVSSKAYYVSPTRGQMGNAFKCIWAAPFVATGSGHVEIESHGERHIVAITVDRIAQRPEIRHARDPSVVKTGTVVKIHWRDSSRLLSGRDGDSYNATPTAAELVAGFAAFNPHARFVLDGHRLERTITEWSKWRPDQPTSAHWYDSETLRELVAAYIARERDGGPAKTVRKLVAEFRGLAGTAKQKLVTEGWSGMRLHDFVADGDVSHAFVAELLQRMQAHSTAPPPRALGVIGREHLTAWMVSEGVAEESIRYVQKVGVDGLPFVLEVAFGVNVDDGSRLREVKGLNWSPSLGGDLDPTLRAAIAEARLDPHDPVTFVAHIARPRFQFADRGKTRVQL